MSEISRRTESLQPLYEEALSLAHEMGEKPQQRLDWLMQQTGESFGNVLIRINSTARNIDKAEHLFDGEGVRAGGIDPSIPPEQEDKLLLMDELVLAAQQHTRAQLESGEDPQTIVTELAVIMPTAVNKLHLFADGNGRTSRTLRMMLRDGDQITTEKVEAVAHRKGFEKYDTTPATIVERSVVRHMRTVNGTSEIAAIDDVVDAGSLVENTEECIKREHPNIKPSVIDAYFDTINFNEAVRLLAKEKDINAINLSDLFSQVAENPDESAKLVDAYRHVRKQRVQLLISGLIGQEPVPLDAPDKADQIRKWINAPRARQGLQPIDPALIDTIQEFQTAYCESFSPERDEAA